VSVVSRGAGDGGRRPEAAPALVACGHGTRRADGRRVLAELRLDVAARRAGLEVLPASVDVQRPALAEVVDGLVARGRPAVVVPLLLAAGYHVRVDVAGAVAASGGLVRAAAPLGPDPVLAAILSERLDQAEVDPDDPVVVAAAGSSDARAISDVEAVVAELAARRPGPVAVGYLSAARPTLPEAIGSAHVPGRRTALATYLLAPGVFSRRLAGAGAHVVTGPLAPHPALADLVLRRYDAVARTPGYPPETAGSTTTSSPARSGADWPPSARTSSSPT
jgi:sirohydrochlorin ferrochelatase